MMMLYEGSLFSLMKFQVSLEDTVSSLAYIEFFTEMDVHLNLESIHTRFELLESTDTNRNSP